MDSQVQEIKDKLSIQEVVGEYIKLERAGRNFRARCPFHKEKTPSFMISPERGSYICFGCGEKGDIFTFVEKIEHVDFRTALKQLAEKAGVVLKNTYVSTQDSAEKKEKDEQLRDVCEDATLFFQSELKKRSDVLDYLKEKRGVTDETIQGWRIGYAPAHWRDLSEHLVAKGYSKDLIVEAGLAVRPGARSNLAQQHEQGSTLLNTDSIYDRFRGRIMFPLFDVGGKVIAFSGRFFEARKDSSDPRAKGMEPQAEPAKYINSPETPIFKKSRVLYGLDKAKNFIRKADCILLVEGQFDVIMSHQSGLPFAVASSGTAITEEHLSLLSRYSKRLVLALDADTAGIRAGLKTALAALKMGFDVKIPNFNQVSLDKSGKEPAQHRPIGLPAGQAGSSEPQPGVASTSATAASVVAKDPADLAKEDPELLKQAVRSSKTAVEFFLDALRPQARDGRAYAKLVEAQVVPLIAAIPSKIDQAHFIRTVAERLRMPEAAIHAEVIKRPVLSSDEVETNAVLPETAQLSSLERTAAMLLFSAESEEKLPAQERSTSSWGGEVSEKIASLIGLSRIAEIRQRFEGDAEKFRFEFDALGEDKAAVAASLLESLERGALEEEMSNVQGQLHTASAESQGALMQKLLTLKKRQQELRK